MRRRLALLAPLVVPWSVQLFAVGDATLLFPWGLVNTNPPQVTTLSAYLFRYTAGLPRYILAWPLTTLSYLAALATAALARVDLESPRVTAGFLVLAGLGQFTLARGFSVQPDRMALPVGTILLLGLAYWYWRTASPSQERSG